VRKYLLDSSFVIDLLNEIADGKAGSASSWLKRNPAARLWITPVTLAEVLEGAEDPEAVKSYLGRYSWQGIHRVHAAKVAQLQRRSSRRLGENDAWQVAVAVNMEATVVGHDPNAFQRTGVAYEDHRRTRR
jgi:predicted nucleic acid-binding protein